MTMAMNIDSIESLSQLQKEYPIGTLFVERNSAEWKFNYISLVIGHRNLCYSKDDHYLQFCVIDFYFAPKGEMQKCREWVDAEDFSYCDYYIPKGAER